MGRDVDGEDIPSDSHFGCLSSLSLSITDVSLLLIVSDRMLLSSYHMT